MQRLPSGLGVVVVALLAGGVVALPAGAQTASQVTPPTFAPPTRAPGGPVVIPQDQGTTAPAGSEAVQLRLADVELSGGDEVDRSALKARLVGRTVTIAEIFAAAHALEIHYARSGRVLTRVIVPPQRLADGATLRLDVLRGYIETVDTSHLSRHLRRRVARVLASLVGARDVTQRQIERRLLLAADTPGAQLRSTLTPGTKPGATVLVVESSYRPVSGFVSADNTLPSSLGRDAFGVGVNLNSLLGQGETIYLRVSGLPSGGATGAFTGTPRDRSLAGGFIVPIGDQGLTFNLEGTDARTAARHLDTLPGFDSRFRRLSARLHYPVVRTRALTLDTEVALDVEDERVRVIAPTTLPISLDRLRIARFVGDLTSYTPTGGVATVRAELSVGLDALGARTAADATPTLPLSRQGTDADVKKLLVSVGFDQPLAPHLGFSLHAKAQTGFGEVLSNAEQVGIATTDGISPLPSGTLQGDKGAVSRGEVRAPFVLPLGKAFASIAPYAFGAVGFVGFERPTSVERRATDADAWGGGVRLAGAAQGGLPGVSASVEYGVARVDGLPGHPSRVSFTVIAQF